jgi:predicted RNA-binding Zn-ribbon protein involved in translation (DUF1610 family)
VMQAYRFAVDPTPTQEAALRSDCGAQRFAFNWGLALVKANLGQRHTETSSGVRAGELTPAVPWSAYSLRKRWNRAKDERAPWWGENSKEAYSSGLANLATAPAQLVRVASRHPGRPKAEVSLVQGQAGGVLVPVGHRRGRPGPGRPPACEAAPHRPGAHPRVHPHAGPACRARPGTDPIGHPSRIGPGVGSASFSVEITRTPSAKTCSHCGAVKTKLRLAERTYRCDQCGLVADRDLNAARNLAPLVDQVGGRHVLPELAWATVNEPEANPHQTRTTRAAGTATGRPTPTGAGQRRHGNTPTQNTSLHVF